MWETPEIGAKFSQIEMYSPCGEAASSAADCSCGFKPGIAFFMAALKNIKYKKKNKKLHWRRKSEQKIYYILKLLTI